MSTPPSIDKFDRLMSEIVEQQKCLKNLMVKLERGKEMVEKLKMDKEKAHQLFESGVRELEQTALTVKAVLEPIEVKKEKKLQITNSPTKVKRNVGEYSGSGTKEVTIISCNSGVAKLNQGQKPGIRGTYKLVRVCDLMIISSITKNLVSEDLKGFRESCFGRLLEIKKLESQGHILLHLLWQMDIDASSDEKLVFKINDSNFEFGPKEFSQITGLRVGAWDGTIKGAPSSLSIHKKIFKGRPRILLKEVKEAFLCHKGKGELSLKLALLYFLYGTLLAGSKNKRVDLRYMDLVEDLKRFNEFPWGQVAYEFLASSCISTRVIMDNRSEIKKRSSLIMCGFSVALQVWAFEVIPSLAEHFAVRLNISENLTPWILHWSTRKRMVGFDNLRRFFTPGGEAHLEDVTNDTNRHPAEDDAIVVSDTDDDGDDDLVFRQTNKRNRGDFGETRNAKRRCKSIADFDAQSTDSDVGSCSSAHMMRVLQNKTSTNRKQGDHGVRKFNEDAGTISKHI